MSWEQELVKLKELIAELGAEELAEQLQLLEQSIRKLDNERYCLEAELQGMTGRESGDDMVYEDPVYWQKKGSDRDGPFCQVCWDTSTKRIRLHKEEQGWSCKVCGNSFNDDESSPFRYNPAF